MLDLTLIKKGRYNNITLCTWYHFQQFCDKLFIQNNFEAYQKEYYIKDTKLQTLKKKRIFQ